MNFNYDLLYFFSDSFARHECFSLSRMKNVEWKKLKINLIYDFIFSCQIEYRNIKNHLNSVINSKIQVLKVMKFFNWIISEIYSGKIASDCLFVEFIYIYLKFAKWIWYYNNIQNEIFLCNFWIKIFISRNVNFINEKTLHTMNQDFGKDVSIFCSNLLIIFTYVWTMI